MLRTSFFILVVSFLSIAPSPAVETSVIELATRIDQHIDRLLAEEGIEAAEPIDAAGYLRRVTLDLAGRIPTLSERDGFLGCESAKAKEVLVQRLINSPDYAYHSRNQLDILLLLRQERNDGWREYLLEAARENRPWDQLFREIVLPEETRGTDIRPVAFLKRRVNDLDAMTNDLSVTWLGVNIACAKCHDHPLVDDWTQAHYYGMAAFFKRTFITKKGFASERFSGAPKYTTISGEEHQAEPMFLTGKRVTIPPLEIDADALKKLEEAVKKSEQDDKADSPPRPDFRPRSEFVALALDDDEKRYFARNLVNRLWARFFGRGLVHPLDQLHSQNEGSHPELLDELAVDIQDSGYDVRRLVHALVLTKAYARSIRPRSTANIPPPEFFAVAVPRALSPQQLSLSLHIAGRNPEKLHEWQSGEEWTVHRDELERQADGLARRLVIPEDDGFQVSVSEALWFSNNPSVENDILNGSGDRLVGYLKQINDDDEVVNAAFRAVLNRDAAIEEVEAASAYLAERKERREQSLKQFVWALMSTPEFRFNH